MFLNSPCLAKPWETTDKSPVASCPGCPNGSRILPFFETLELDFVTWCRPATDALPFQDRRRGRGLDLVK